VIWAGIVNFDCAGATPASNVTAQIHKHICFMMDS